MNICELFEIVSAMVVAGLIGGLVNYSQLDHSLDDSNKQFLQGNLFRVMVLAVSASLLVPVFLQMISSNIITESTKTPKDFLVFFGFCLAAAITSRAFVESITKKLLNQIEETKQQVQEVSTQAKQETQEIKILKSENLLLEGWLLRKENKYKEALLKLNEAIVLYETDRAWGNKALVLFNLGDIQGALNASNKALELPSSNTIREAEIRWNRACYLSLLEGNVHEIISDLKRAIEINSDLQNLVSKEPDLEYARKDPSFRTAFNI